jgi:hypothetical protein
VKEEEWKEIPMCTYRRRTGFKVRLKPSRSKLSENIPFKALNLDLEAPSTVGGKPQSLYVSEEVVQSHSCAVSPLSSAFTIAVAPSVSEVLMI